MSEKKYDKGEKMMTKYSLDRWLRYFYLRLIRLRGSPKELALGTALGIFFGMMPIVPFQMAFAVALALLFKASKITAAIGTWVSNPVTIYLVYRYCHRIGSFILGFDESRKIFSAIAEAHKAEEPLKMLTTILSGGGLTISAFLLGGLVLGIICAVPSYFLFLYFFKTLHSWRGLRKSTKPGKTQSFHD